MVLIADLIGGGDRLHLLQTLRLLADINVNVLAGVEDESVALVHRADRDGNLTDANVLLALDMEQSLVASSVDFDFLEARSDAARHVTDSALEVVQEKLTLVILNFAMLHRRTSELVIKLNGEDGSGASLVLSRLRSQPEVDVPRQNLALAFKRLRMK